MYTYKIKPLVLFLLIKISLITLLAFESASMDLDVVRENLQIKVELVGADDSNPNGDGSGKVFISASKTNALRYAFRFDDGELLESESGKIEHLFTKEGVNTYTMVVWAYSESGQFVSKPMDLEVLRSFSNFSNLVFSDEFEYEGKLDEEKWFHQTIALNDGSWFNEEVQHYTNRIENSFVSDGSLKIKAIKEEYTYEGSTKSYTSARLNSKFAFQYGRVEVRAKLPASAGTWPAIWTLGANVNETGNYFGDKFGSVGWPACGEIDIMEQKGEDKSKVLGYFHWGDTNTGEYKTTGNEISIANADDSYHVYTMVWNEVSIKLKVDGKIVIDLPNTQDKPYDNPHYVLLNIAMGGALGGPIPADFTEDTFEIDYIRIYQ
ncbi:Glycosyl hydrolases family 16 [Marivirga sericea]|uniref:Glycosyl hydrolases family 16 n=1 Tax=Marivirga sericea TaxID=1028 RepID=A0A1X7I622_9BACT|nr:glycoside hydrolase family 16 protein [Marivirga sericea]SMG09705.1 Glycosyl hydrolases family 16 [Marivirga sericea]